MKKLAQTIGLQLFVQKGRQMELTDAGRELNAAILAVFARLGQLEETLSSLRPAGAATRIEDSEFRKIGGAA